MKGIEIAKAYGVDDSLISHIKRGRKFTDNVELAISISALSGKKPIQHIKKKLRRSWLQARPELGEPVKKVS